MSREVRVIAKSFDWPLNKTWWGYVLPPIPCKQCMGLFDEDTVNCPVCGGTQRVYPQVTLEWFGISSDFGQRVMRGDFDSYGFQMWEITSEGSPISPICDSPEDLAQWLADNGASASGSLTADYETWLKMIRVGYAPSAVFSESRGMQSGVEFIAKEGVKPTSNHVE